MTVLAVIIIFFTMIVSHELGHFLAARACGMYVEDFSIGMGPSLWTKKGKGTTFHLRLLPIGGWCKIQDEEGEPTDAGSFTSKPVWMRILVSAAGSLMNVVVAVIILAIVFMSVESYSSESLVGGLEADSPAAAAGLESGDRLIEINGVAIEKWDDITPAVNAATTDSIQVVVLRDGQRLQVEITPYVAEDGSLKIGITPALYRAGFFEAVGLGVRQALAFGKGLIEAVVMMIRGDIAVDVAGPIGMVSVIDNMMGQGVFMVALFTGYILLNLAIMNMLPLPALDGFKVLCLIIEGIRRKPLNRRTEGLINAIGFAALMVLVVVIAISDIQKLI